MLYHILLLPLLLLGISAPATVSMIASLKSYSFIHSFIHSFIIALRSIAVRARRARLVRHVASVDVRRRSVCERFPRNQRLRLQRHCTSTYGNVYGDIRSVNGV